jgi:hypothetical protein
VNTPITNSHALDVYTNQGDGWVTEEKATDGEYVPSEISRRLETDRAALMEVCNRLAELDLNGTDDLLIRFIVVAHQNSATHALTAARANFPTL